MGFREGRVKTSLGLYNDTQDQEFLHTWALLPQSLYPADLRSVALRTWAETYTETFPSSAADALRCLRRLLLPMTPGAGTCMA